MKLLPFAAAVAFMFGTFTAEAQAQGEPITVAEVPSVPAAAIYMAVEKGYFKEAGLNVELQNIESSSTAMALLASNRVQVVGGGVAPNYWNALASGLPCVVSDQGGPKDLVVPGETGAITRALDVDGFASAILELLQNPATLTTMRTNARAAVEGRDWREAARRFWACTAGMP